VETQSSTEALAGTLENGSVRRGSRDITGHVHRSLRDAILKGEIAAGTDLSQVWVAKQLGVSRGPVREALRLLEREGLIEARVNHRARVTAFSVSDLEAVYALRIVTDALAISVSVSRSSDDDFAEIHRLLTEMESVEAENDADRWDACHREFHLAICMRAGERLLQTVEQLYDHAVRYRRFAQAHHPQAREWGRLEHRQIVEACDARDSRLASIRLARHLSRTALQVLSEVAPEHEPTSVRVAVRQVTAGEALADPYAPPR
jgi:DNA-binding GntR family transcriptional regulator